LEIEMEKKAFSVPAIVSLTTGRLLCDFSAMHEIAEWVMGHPIWTHEFASEAMWGLMKMKVREQHPDLPDEAPEWVERDTWEKWRDQLVAQFGATRELTKGDEERDADPITTARNIIGPDKPIIAI
jgi:hypothetical protein